MTVTEQSAHQEEHAGRRYYFCSAGCKTKFNVNPAQYTATKLAEVQKTPVAEPRMAARQAGPQGTIYTCPMHPEIRQNQPGLATAPFAA
jgi:Cu+-exporting ATPase